MTDASQNRIQSFGFVIAASISVLFSTGFAASSFFGSGQSYKVELNEKINPNNAPIASLVRLPGIGIGRAAAIMTYRENFSKQNDGRLAFETIDDLQKVKGIGPKTIQNISRWLRFE